MELRHLEARDYAPIIAVVDAWWGGRAMAGMLPKLFFLHFRPTSVVIEHEAQIVAFLIGFVSQTNPAQAYIHFVGVHPRYRRQKLGQQLYNHFFNVAQQHGCQSAHCVTSPINTGSIAFHTRMGFTTDAGDAEINGVAVARDYDGPGQHRVRFTKQF